VGVQPPVTPAAARRLMSASWTEVSSSVKASGALPLRPRVRTRKLAICSRVTDPLGQYVVGVQPVVMPWRASQAMSDPNGAPTGTALKPPESVAVSGGVEVAVMVWVAAPPSDHPVQVYGNPSLSWSAAPSWISEPRMTVRSNGV